MRRREFITVLGGAAAAWPLATRAQQPTPVVGFLSSRSPNESAHLVAAFRQGLEESGYLEGQNVHISFRWAEGAYARLPELAAELVHARVAVIVSVGGPISALAAKQATATIPIVAVASDPVKHGLVASFNRPGGNVTVVSPSSTVLGAKRLGLLHDLVPGAALIGHLVNPNSPDRDGQLRDAEEAARTLGWQIHVVYAGTERDIDAGFAGLVRQKAGALLVSSDPFFDTRRDQIVALAAQCHTDNVCPALLRRRWWAHELCTEFCRSLSTGGHLCRADSQRRKAGRFASGSVKQIRACNQYENSQGAGHRGAQLDAIARRRGDRIAILFAAVHMSANGMARPCSRPARRKVLRGLRSTRGTSHVTQIRTTHRQHDRHRSR